MTRAIETHHITTENIYNWDEKGFLIGHCGTTRRILTKQAYQNGRVRSAQQDGSREFISLLACVCADGTTLPPALIYKGASNDLQDSWLDDLSEKDQAYFTSSAKGWTSDQLGLAWLRRFHQDTTHKARNRKRLLIVDGHSSHVNMEFLTLADSLRILILVLPPHSTHRLQPLDIGLFSPLATAYTKELNNHTHKSLGWVSMTKRMFWSIFRTAWKQSFTAVNILKAFAKSGIWPINAQTTLKRIQIPQQQNTPSKLPQLSARTPITVRGLRRLIKSTPSRAKNDLLERAVLRLAVQREIISHENRGLRGAITQEKQRRQRGKRLNLVGDEEDGKAQFFSPRRILAAKAYQNNKQQAEEENKLQRTQRKELAAVKRQQKQEEKEERARRRQEEAVQRSLRQEEEKLRKEEAKRVRQAQTAKVQAERAQAKLNKAESISLAKKRQNRTDLDEEELRPKKRQKATSAKSSHTSTSTNPDLFRPNGASKDPDQPPQLLNQAIPYPEVVATQADVEEVQICTRRGRAVRAPQRFLK